MTLLRRERGDERVKSALMPSRNSISNIQRVSVFEQKVCDRQADRQTDRHSAVCNVAPSGREPLVGGGPLLAGQHDSPAYGMAEESDVAWHGNSLPELWSCRQSSWSRAAAASQSSHSPATKPRVVVVVHYCCQRLVSWIGQNGTLFRNYCKSGVHNIWPAARGIRLCGPRD